MSLSYEDALATLCSMFQSWDRETIAAIFESNGYHVERTIETILSMEQPEGNNSNNSTNNNSNNNNNRVHENLLDLEEISFTSTNVVVPAPKPSTSSKTRNNQNFNDQRSQSNNSKRRGIPCVLPDDFLRLPGEKKDNQYLQDEQLALLLQNELFQREIEQTLGADYLTHIYSNNPNNPNLPGRSQPNTNSNLAFGSPANVHQPHHHPPTESIPDMGILKSLQSMGEGVKQQLNLLAVQFNQTAAAALESIEGKRSRSNSGSERHGSNTLDSQEVRPLTGGDYEEEDDEDGPLIGSGSNTNTSYGNNNLAKRQYGKKDK